MTPKTNSAIGSQCAGQVCQKLFRELPLEKKRLISVPAQFVRSRVEFSQFPLVEMDFVQVNEAMYLRQVIGPLQKIPVLLRRHSSQLPFETPSTQHETSSYFVFPENFGPNSIIQCQVLLFLNDQKHPPTLLPTLYLSVSERINRVQQKLSNSFGTEYMNAVCDPQKEHVVLVLSYKMSGVSALFADLPQICSNLKSLLCFLRKYIDEEFPNKDLE
ncbi:hypothetical protein niasHT_011547 [Heterodera trifolii]|uniref:Uncharacterized protein n=1 Tax=Heterodera trifolii TaxID=157864 RepID=A0ABD2LGJ5_9BILA